MIKVIKTQDELDRLMRVKASEEVIIESALHLNGILEVFGVLKIRAKLNCNRSSERYIVARENASVEARGNASVVAWGNSFVRTLSISIKLSLHGFSMLALPFNLNLKFKKEKTCLVQRYKPLPYLGREGVPVIKNKVILFKRVSLDYKTQKGTSNETLWQIGPLVIHPAWSPKEDECGSGKFHACSRPYFCDEFRDTEGDRYVAIEIATKDLYEWPDATYPHKIAFREGKVLFECDRFGRKVEQ